MKTIMRRLNESYYVCLQCGHEMAETQKDGAIACPKCFKEIVYFIEKGLFEEGCAANALKKNVEIIIKSKEFRQELKGICCMDWANLNVIEVWPFLNGENTVYRVWIKGVAVEVNLYFRILLRDKLKKLGYDVRWIEIELEW